MIQGLLVSRAILYKWKRSDTELCPYCKEKEDVKHIYFNCKRIEEIWCKVGKILDVNIQWKHIVLGFTQDVTVHRVRNLLFKVISYAIFKLWLNSLDTKSILTSENMWKVIKNDIIVWYHVINITNFDKNHDHFKQIWKHLINRL